MLSELSLGIHSDAASSACLHCQVQLFEAVKSPAALYQSHRGPISLKETNGLPKAAIRRFRFLLPQSIPPIRILQRPAQPASALIKVLAVLVSDLPTRATPAVLPAFLEAWVQVGADDALVQLGAADVLEAVERVLVGKVLDEAEAARGLVEPIQPHYESLDLAALAEQLVHLLLGREEREVTHVERRRVCEGVLLGRLLLGLGVSVAVLAAIAGFSVVAAALVELVDRERSAQLNESSWVGRGWGRGGSRIPGCCNRHLAGLADRQYSVTVAYCWCLVCRLIEKQG